MSMTAAAPAGRETRIGRLRERIIQAPQEICVERARFLTETMAAHWDEPPLRRMSLALENILAKMSVIIRDGELIVGCRTSKLKGAPLFPENKARWIEGDVDNFDARVVQRALITEAEKVEIKEKILPFWQGRTVEEYFESLLPEDVSEDMDKYIFTFMLEITYGIGHFTLDYERVLAQGLAGVISQAREKMGSLAEGDDRRVFYEAAVRSMEAAITFARRYAALAESQAAGVPDPARAAELRQIAEVCRRVPENPPQSFHQAVQFVYFLHLIAQIESGGNSISLGRIDQYLWPYYERDAAQGAVTPNQARELLACLFVKANEIWNVLEEAYIPGGEGTEGKTTQNVVVGGMGPDGRDAANDLTYLGLEAYASVRTVQPNFGVRFCDGSPDSLHELAAECARDGVLLHFFHDEAIVESLVKAGHTLEDARNYGPVGCLEPNAQGKSFGSTFAVQFNGIKCLELALSNGVDNIFGFQSGLETGDPAEFDSFDRLWQAYDEQVSHFTNQFVRGIACLDRAIAEMLPSPFASAMIDGPLEKGLDATSGGALYNSTGVQFMGFSNVADSLYALDRAVYHDGRFTLGQLAEWLSDDWLDAEDKRLYLRRKVDKYGNDLTGPDRMAARVLDHFCDVLSRHTNYRGGAFWPGVFSVGFHLAMGAFTGATPDGRTAGELLGNGITPTNAVSLSGPTAIMNSVAKLPLTRVHNGCNLNMRFSGRNISAEKLAALVKSYFESGGLQVQFNMVDSQVLEAARDNPEQYRDLIVRVSGYSAIFVNLSDIAQEEIINRIQCRL